jgi:hypothetical protein
MNRIAFLLQVSAQLVLNWIRAFALEHYEKPEPPAKQSSYSWTRYCPISRKSAGSFESGKPSIGRQVNYWTGNVVGVTK